MHDATCDNYLSLNACWRALCIVGHNALTPTHPHWPPPTQNNVPYTPFTPTNPKYCPTHPKQPTLTQNNASLTVTHTKYGPTTHIFLNFSLITRLSKVIVLQKLIAVFMVSYIYTKRMAIKFATVMR